MNIFSRIMFSILFVFFAGTAHSGSGNKTVIPGKWAENIKVEYEFSGEKKFVPVRIYFPTGYKPGKKQRTIIALHGYKFKERDWSENTDLRKYAEDYNFVIVCPAMGSTLYETKFYPESENKWDGIPGGEWIAKVLIEFLRNAYNLAGRRDTTGIMGISMGGRGAILLAECYPKIFGAAAGISGYYDSSSFVDNKMFISIYGQFADFRERWEKDDNIIELAVNLKNTAVYLAHGKRDKQSPVEQSRLLAIRLKQLQKKNEGRYIFEYHEGEIYQAHDWAYWRPVTQDVMGFFDKNLKK